MKLSRKSAAVLGLVALPFLMAQSAPSGCTQEQVTAIAMAAVNTGCAVVAEINAANLQLTQAEKALLASSTGFCPPNPPPTNMTAALTDFVASVPAILAIYARANPAKAKALSAEYERKLTLMRR
jgi:hypothetical protein